MAAHAAYSSARGTNKDIAKTFQGAMDSIRDRRTYQALRTMQPSSEAAVAEAPTSLLRQAIDILSTARQTDVQASSASASVASSLVTSLQNSGLIQVAGVLTTTLNTGTLLI
jgi:hypothetical protein